MKMLSAVTIAVLSFAAACAKAGDPLSPAEVTAMVAAVAPGQNVRIAPRKNSGFLIYGPDGKTGAIFPNGTGWNIRYGADLYNVHRNGRGWVVSSGGNAPRNVRSDGSGGITVSGGGTLNVRSNGTGYAIFEDGRSRTVVPNGKGWSVSGGR